MKDKKEKPTSTNINCEKTIYRKFLKTLENTEFLTMRFLHF